MATGKVSASSSSKPPLVEPTSSTDPIQQHAATKRTATTTSTTMTKPDRPAAAPDALTTRSSSSSSSSTSSSGKSGTTRRRSLTTGSAQPSRSNSFILSLPTLKSLTRKGSSSSVKKSPAPPVLSFPINKDQLIAPSPTGGDSSSLEVGVGTPVSGAEIEGAAAAAAGSQITPESNDGSATTTTSEETTTSASPSALPPTPKRQYTATGNERIFPMRNVVHARPGFGRRTTTAVPQSTSSNSTSVPLGSPPTAFPPSAIPPALISPPLTNRSPHPLETPRAIDEPNSDYFTHAPVRSPPTMTGSQASTSKAISSAGDQSPVAGVFSRSASEWSGGTSRPGSLRDRKTRTSCEKLVTPSGCEMWVITGQLDDGLFPDESPRNDLLDDHLQYPSKFRPSAVQPFGVLFALQEDSNGNFAIMQVSENSEKVLGISAETWFKTPSFTAFLTPSSLDTFLDAVDALDDALPSEAGSNASMSASKTSEADSKPFGGHSLSTPVHPDSQDKMAENSTTQPPPEHFRLSLNAPASLDTAGDGLATPRRTETLLHCALHRPDPVHRPHRSILEVELVDDALYPLTTVWEPPPTPRSKDELESPEEKVVNPMDPSAEEIFRSTVSLMKPLRALGKRRARNASDINMVQLVFQIEEQLRRAKDLDSFLSITAGIFKELTGFDRSVVFQFDDEWNARVVAEKVDRTRGPQSRMLYRDLTFPATQIPCEALQRGRVGLMYDRDATPARMVARTRDEVDHPLDMTRCSIRAISPARQRALATLGCSSSMSVSLYAFGKLWGFVAMHSYAPTGQRVSVPIRQLCAYLGDSLSRTIERLSYERRLQARRIINTSANSEMPTRIIANGEELLQLFSADFGCLSVGEEAKILGEVGNSQELFAVLEYLRGRRFLRTQASNEIMTDFPDLTFDLKQIAGILVVPLSDSGLDFIFFARKSESQEIRWAGGNPADGPTLPNGRAGIEVYRQTFTGRSRTWSDESIETADVLGLIYSKFISVWREKEQAMQANSVTSLLLANASHEVRTPLNAILNFLELALDASTDGAVNENLQRTHDASRSLIHVINDLLDLTRYESGGELFIQAPFDLRTTIEDAISVQRSEADRRGLKMEVIENPQGTPTLLIGDRAKIRQILSTTVGNAVKYTESGSITIEYGELVDSPDEVDAMVEASTLETIARKESIRIGISITDTGRGMPEDQLDALFSALHHVKNESTQPPEIGLGLAVAARIVQQLQGQLRVESEVGKGSKFTFIFPFRLPGESDTIRSDGSSSNKARDHSVSPSPARPLLRRSSSNSGGSQESVHSRDSRKSEIDSLITAISSSHLEHSNRRATGAALNSATNHQHRHKLNRLGPKYDQNGVRTLSRPLSMISMDGSSLSRRASNGNLASLATSPNASSTYLAAGMPALTVTRSSSPAPRSVRSFPSVSPPLAPPPSIAEIPAPLPEPLKGLKILVVEDERINRTLIERRLVKDEHRITVVEHGGMAVRAIEADPTFDLILMDLNMPIMDGFEASATIRRNSIVSPSSSSCKLPRGAPISHQLNNGIPIIAVSANIDERRRDKLTENGIDGWCMKPIRFLRLTELINGATNVEQRKLDLYKPGEWERGGWLTMRRNQSPKSSKPKVAT